MKKYILVTLFLTFLFTASTNAQEVERRFQGAAVIGFNMAQLDGDDLVGYHQIGLNAGARVYTRINEKWRFSMELLYSQQGSNRSAKDALRAAVDKIRLNFAAAPLLIHFTCEDVSDLQNYDTDIFTWVADVSFFFQENLGLNVRWSRNINSIRADEGSGRLIGKFVTIRGIYIF